MASISKRIDTKGKAIKVSYFYYDNLRNKIKTSRSFDDESEAELFRIKVEENERSGSDQTIAYSNRDIKWLIDTFVEVRGKTRWSPNVYNNNIGKLNSYVIPFIGKQKIGELNGMFIDTYYTKLRTVRSVKNNEYLSKNMLISIHKLMMSICKYAVEKDIINKNPCIGANTITHKTQKKKIWETDSLKFALSDTKDEKFHLIINMMFACTLRPSELSGLKIDDIEFHIDEEQSTLVNIKREFARVNKDGYEASRNRERVLYKYPSPPSSKTFMAETELKNEYSEREILIPDHLAILLLKEIEKVKSIRNRFKKEYKNRDFIFVDYNSGRPRDKDAIREMFIRYIKKNNLEKITPHAMRHMSITQKLFLTGDIKSVQADAGHESAKMINEIYSHVQKENRIRAVGLLERNFYNEFSTQVEENEEFSENEKDILSLIKGNKKLLNKILALEKDNLIKS